MSSTQTNSQLAINAQVNTGAEVEAMQTNLTVNNDQCALGVQVNGPGHVTVAGDVLVRQDVVHNHTEQCQVDRFAKNVKNETNKTVERVSNEVDRSGKKVEKEFKRFIRKL